MFVSKSSSRRLQDTSSVQKFFVMQEFLEEEKLLRWRDVEDVFKKSLEEVFKKFWVFFENLHSYFLRVQEFYMRVLFPCEYP